MSSKPDALAAASSDVGPELYYRRRLDEGEFLIQHCDSCARNVFYPRMICPHCGHDTLSWRTPSGAGVVYSTTVVRRRAEHGGDYNVALIDLDEGVRMMSRVDGIAPDAVDIGMRVKASIIDDSGEGRTGKIVVFTPAEDKQ